MDHVSEKDDEEPSLDLLPIQEEVKDAPLEKKISIPILPNSESDEEDFIGYQKEDSWGKIQREEEGQGDMTVSFLFSVRA